jgi:hypothetical protein
MKLPVNYNQLTWQQRRAVRQAYVKKQNGKCMYCGESLSVKPTQDKVINWDLFPPNFLKYPIHLQHDHETGLTEGAVHAYCNAVMWQYERR